jgi:Calmodulin binding protein-like
MQILGTGMSNKMWDSLVEHAKTCVLSGKHYIFYSDHTRITGAVFNNIYEFVGLINGAQFYSAESLTESQRVSSYLISFFHLFYSVLLCFCKVFLVIDYVSNSN